jgi:hypothetical protein
LDSRALNPLSVAETQKTMIRRKIKSFPVASFCLAVTYAVITTAHLVRDNQTAMRLYSGESPSSSVAPCPTQCTCTTSPTSGSAITSLVILCHDQSESGNASLEFEALFSSLHSEPLTLLHVVGSFLAVVPPSMCGFTKLQSLNLDMNRLTALPDDYLNRMTKLKVFSAANNYITALQVE